MLYQFRYKSYSTYKYRIKKKIFLAHFIRLDNNTSQGYILAIICNGYHLWDLSPTNLNCLCCGEVQWRDVHAV